MMTGLTLSRAYYEECGRPMLERDFPELLPRLAIGLFGAGSECLGYDDEISRDHDFEPGFCLLLPDEDAVDRHSEFLLERAYAALPKSFHGFQRERVEPVGGARHGVLRTEEFFRKTVGSANGVLTAEQWLAIPSQALLEATNGAVFHDEWGEVTLIRERLRCFPEDIRRKRLAGQLLLMAQAGQYNYGRCLRHGEAAAAALAANEFVRSALSVCFLLNNCYEPYYKWSFRALRTLPILSELEKPLAGILSADRAQIEAQMETVSDHVAGVLRMQELTTVDGSDLERHAYAVNARVLDASLRNLHILASV